MKFTTCSPVLALVSLLIPISASLSYAQPASNRPTTTTTRKPVTTKPSTTSPNAPTISVDTLTATLQAAERAQNADALLLSYGQAVTDPILARSALTQLLSNYYTLRNQAKTADQAVQAISEASLRFQVLQAAQNQVIIQQNQQLLQQNDRIISLLEAQAQNRPRQ